MEQIDVKKILIEFAHWIILGVSVIIIGATFALGGETKIQKTQKNIEKALKTLQVEMENNQPQKEKLPLYVETIKSNWAKLEIAKKGPDQDFLYEKAKISYKHAVPPTQQWISSCKEIRLRVDREKITASWDTPEAPLGADGKAKEMTEISGYHLCRSWTNEANKKVEEIYKLEDTSYEDTKVEPKVDYYYKVRAFTNNTDAKGGKTIVFEDKKVVVSEYTPEKKGTILPLYRLKLNGVSGDTAFIELSKWEKGDWRSVTFYVKKGEKIEKNAYIKELKKTVQFSPGWNLVDVTTKRAKKAKITHKIIKIDPVTKQPLKDHDGNIIIEIKEEIVTYYVAAIKYTDEKGKLEIKEQEVSKPEAPKQESNKQESDKKPK